MRNWFRFVEECRGLVPGKIERSRVVSVQTAEAGDDCGDGDGVPGEDAITESRQREPVEIPVSTVGA
jgi:hypothetical protein